MTTRSRFAPFPPPTASVSSDAAATPAPAPRRVSAFATAPVMTSLRLPDGDPVTLLADTGAFDCDVLSETPTDRAWRQNLMDGATKFCGAETPAQPVLPAPGMAAFGSLPVAAQVGARESWAAWSATVMAVGAMRMAQSQERQQPKPFSVPLVPRQRIR